MGRLRVAAGATLALALALLVAATLPAGAQMQALDTSIDLNYTYGQERDGDDVTASTGFQQKYEVKLSTTLSSSFDFLGALSVDLDNAWDTGAAATSKISPSLELNVKGPQSGVRFTYTGTIDETEEYEETPGSTKYTNSADIDLELTPAYWPELKFKLQETRDYQEGSTDTSSRSMELQLRDELFDVQWDFSLKLADDVDHMQSSVTEAIDWSWKATYKEVLLRDIDFELAYEISESYSEDALRGVFTGSSEDYSQSLKTRLKKSLELSPRLSANLAWEYTFEQDLLALEFDYKVQNKYSLDARLDVLPSLKVTADATRETGLVAASTGGEDTSTVTDTFRGAFDFDPVYWLRVGGKAEWKFDRKIDEGTGGSVDHAEDEQYELTAKNQWGDFWDLAASASWTRSWAEGVLQDQESKFKADLKLKVLDQDWADLNVSPSYESSRSESWDELGEPAGESYTSDARIKFEARAAALNDLLKVTFSHEYGQKITEDLDEVLNYTRELSFNESTRLNLATNLFQSVSSDLKLEGEVERKADDTEGDEEPQVIEVSYALKLDWKYEALSLSSAFKYTDKAEDDDSMDFTAQIGWRGDRIDLAGDYQFTKTYADLLSETRKLNLKLSYKF